MALSLVLDASVSTALGETPGLDETHPRPDAAPTLTSA
jgi:hypothetical protein